MSDMGPSEVWLLQLRHFLVLAALMFWQGGFTFYAAVVVPIGQHTIGDNSQGFITRQVTDYLNLSGGIALAPLAWDILATVHSSLRRRRLRWLTWLGLVLTLAWLCWLHIQLDELLDLDAWRILDRPAFRRGHRLYLWVSTVQWGLSLVYLGLTLGAWRRERCSFPIGS